MLNISGQLKKGWVKSTPPPPEKKKCFVSADFLLPSCSQYLIMLAAAMPAQTRGKADSTLYKFSPVSFATHAARE